jgi:tRNA(His) 5'-end guanylyltransferase
MQATAMHLCQNIQGVQCCYVQSDEISLLLTDFDKLTTDAWFDYNIQKMTSISAAMAAVEFCHLMPQKEIKAVSGPSMYVPVKAYFDSRVFNLPKEEVCNYFIWRQNDWVRNSVQMLAQAHFSQKQLHKKGIPEMHEMLHAEGVNWAKLQDHLKNGWFIHKGVGAWYGKPAPIFKENRDEIERFLVGEE